MVFSGLTSTRVQSLYGIKLPAILTGLERGDLTDYEASTPGLGYSVAYRGGPVVATLYIYDLGLDEIPEGPKSKVVEEAYLGAVGDAVNSSQYEEVDVLSQTYSGSEPHGPEFLHAAIAALEKSSLGYRAVMTHVFVTGHKNKFVKIRASVSGDAPEKNRVPESFAAELATLFRADIAAGSADEPVDH